MTEVFADAHYWIALASPRDQCARQVAVLDESLATTPLVPTEEVLVEFLGFYSKWGEHLRQVSAELSRAAIRDPRVTVVYQSHASFLRGLDLYERRADKGYNLVDCISMEVMRERGIIDVLSGDQHFRQRGSSR